MRTMPACILTAVLPLAAGLGPASGAKLTLVREGSPRASIVLAARPTRAAQLAAYELQYHVRLITGAELPIVCEPARPTGARILVGESAGTHALGLRAESLGKQEYVIRFVGGALVLLGRDKEDYGQVVYDPAPDAAATATWPGFWDEQGTMYAVYDFLERFCGVRWYNPTEFGTVFPLRKTLVVGGRNVRRAPAFRYRNACYMDSSQYESYTALQPQNPETWKRYEAAAYPELHRRFPDAGRFAQARRGRVQLFRYRMREGGEICLANHSLYGYYARFWERDPNDPGLFEGRKPDWFAQGYEGTPPQMCYTSRGLIEQVAQDARDFFDGKGTKRGAVAGGDFFCVEPMDNASFCKCATCQDLIRRGASNEGEGCFSSGLHSDYFFHFVNEVAKEVRKTHPHKYVVTLAYMTHAYPPRSFRLEPNVAVQFCFASNRMPYARQEYENDLRALEAWAAQAKERPLYLWLYYTFPVEIAVNGKFRCFPGYFAHTIGEQFKLFHRKGYRGMFHCGYGQEVEAYVTYRMMDDPTLNVDALLDEYFSRYYGPAGDPLKRLYLEVEATYCNPANYPERPGHQNIGIAWGRLGTPERMARYARYMEQAKARVRTEVHRRRVELFELATWEYLREGAEQYRARTTAPIPSLRVPRTASAGGDPSAVNWDTAAPLPGPWHVRGQDRPSARKLAGRALHDGRYLYLELVDPCDPRKLVISPQVYPCDTWELFVAAQRGLPYRQIAVGPSGSVVAFSHGEVNWRMNVPVEGHGVRATADVSSGDRWATRLAIPFTALVNRGVAPGGRFYLNIVRVANGSLSDEGGLGIDSWVAYCTVHDVDRLAEVVLE